MTEYRVPRRVARAGRSTRRLTRLVAHTDPVALAGIGLSVALSVALDLTGAASGVESLFAALLGITISLLVDSIARAERRFKLRALTTGAPWLTEALASIVTGTREAVDHYPDSRVAAEARRRFDRLRVETEQLRAGRIVRPGRDYEDLIEATRDCTGRLDAMTNVTPWAGGEPDWWGSDIGRHYWTLNLEALAAGSGSAGSSATTGSPTNCANWSTNNAGPAYGSVCCPGARWTGAGTSTWHSGTVRVPGRAG